MPSSPPINSIRRFPRPWKVDRDQHGFTIRDANSIAVARVYCRDDLHHNRFDRYWEHLTSDEAWRIAKAISRIPEFMSRGRHQNSHRYSVEQWTADGARIVHVITSTDTVQNAHTVFERSVRKHPYALLRLYDGERLLKQNVPNEHWNGPR